MTWNFACKNLLYIYFNLGHLFTYLLAFAVPFCTKYENKQILSNISHMSVQSNGTCPKLSFLFKLGLTPSTLLCYYWDLSQSLLFLNVWINTSWYLTCLSQNHFWTCPKISFLLQLGLIQNSLFGSVGTDPRIIFLIALRLIHLS